MGPMGGGVPLKYATDSTVCNCLNFFKRFIKHFMTNFIKITKFINYFSVRNVCKFWFSYLTLDILIEYPQQVVLPLEKGKNKFHWKVKLFSHEIFLNFINFFFKLLNCNIYSKIIYRRTHISPLLWISIIIVYVKI